MFEFWLLQHMGWNVEWGPCTDETWRLKIGTALTLIYKKFQPHEVPLFLEEAPQMIRELEGAGIVVFPRVDSLEHELWDFLKNRSRHPASERRVSMCRFGQGYHTAEKEKGWWAVERFERTCYALEADLLHAKKSRAKLSAKVVMTEDGDVFGTTSTRKIQLEDRTLRNACANGVAVDVMNKSDPNHYRTLCIIVVTGRPTDRFHTYQNRELRSAEASREF